MKQFLLDQYEYTNQQVRLHHSPYWRGIGLFQEQMLGLLDGYNAVVDHQDRLTLLDILIFQANGDLFDITPALDATRKIDWFRLPQEQFDLKFLTTNHCSALVKIADDLSDVFMGHTSWDDGNCMLRTYKFYYFGNDFQVSLSAYPGTIYSVDDYYVLEREDQKMMVTETSLSVFNEELYSLLSPETLLCWQRVLIANLLSTSAQEWTEIFRQHNSGTYNNQYIVVDTKRFTPGQLPSSGFIWIIEQMPGMAVNMDITSLVVAQDMHWPSYNIPFIKSIYSYSGYDQAYQKRGDKYSYERAPRANIFRRDQHKVQSLEAVKRILRYNDFQNDAYSLNDSVNAIAARGDLRQSPIPFFAIDCKVTSYSKIQHSPAKSDAQNGPTHDQQTPFKWSDFNFTVPHLGQPDEFNFDWIEASAHI